MEIAECGVLLLSQLVFKLHEQLHVRFWLGRAPPDQPSPAGKEAQHEHQKRQVDHHEHVHRRRMGFSELRACLCLLKKSGEARKGGMNGVKLG